MIFMRNEVKKVLILRGISMFLDKMHKNKKTETSKVPIVNIHCQVLRYTYAKLFILSAHKKNKYNFIPYAALREA